MPWDQLARTLGAQLDLRIVLPPDRVLPGTVPTGGYEEILTEQAQQWLAQAAATVSDGIEVTPHISFNESFAQGLIDDAQTLGAEVIVVGAAGDGLIGRHSIGSVTGELLYSAPVPLALAPRGALHSKVERVREVTCAIGTRPGAELLLDTAGPREPGGRQTAAPGFPGCSRSVARCATRRRRIRARTCPRPRAVRAGARAVGASRRLPGDLNRGRRSERGIGDQQTRLA